MKYYNHKKAKEIIESEKANGLLRADLGMHEDWFWTAQTVFEGGEFKRLLFEGDILARHKEYVDCMDRRGQDGRSFIDIMKEFDDILLAGIAGSDWATPVIELYYEDGSARTINCFFVDGDTQGEQPDGLLGVISSEVHNNRRSINVEAK